eukprot:2550976-Rhodomonas_salina.1
MGTIAQLEHRAGTNLPETCPKSTRNLPEIYPKSARNLPEIACVMVQTYPKSNASWGTYPPEIKCKLVQIWLYEYDISGTDLRYDATRGGSPAMRAPQRTVPGQAIAYA